MNRIAGICSIRETFAEREERLRTALANLPGPLTVLHPTPWMTIGYTGEERLFGVRSTPAATAIVYGSAYNAGTCNPPVRVDDTDAAAEHLVSRSGVSCGAANSELFGSYIGAVVDSGAGTVRVMGDPSGNRHPFVSLENNLLCFASHPATCARLGGNVALDRSYEEFFLLYGFYPDGLTPFAGVRQVPPGHFARWASGESATIVESDRSAPEHDEEIDLKDRRSLIDSLYRLLLECTDDQLCTDEHVGVLLGGFDSALVAALLHRAGKRITTYSFRYPESHFNQPHTDTLQRYLGNNHVWVDINPELIAAAMETYGDLYVQPTNWLHYVVQTAEVAKTMRHDGIRVVYSGDGCDAMFLGFPGTFKRTRIFARLPQLPSALVNVLVELAAWPKLERTIGHPYRMSLNLLRATRRGMPERAFLTYRVFDEVSLAQMNRGSPSELVESTEHVLQRLCRPHRNASLQRIGYLAKGLNSPSRIKQLGVTDIHGVAIHAPYMHPAVNAFLAGVPDEFLRSANRSTLRDLGKTLLFEMAQRFELLPESIILQPKLSAIDSPIDSWYVTKLRTKCQARLDALPFHLPTQYQQSLFRDRLTESLYKRYIGSTSVCSDGLSLLLTYASFCALAELSEDGR